MSMPKIAIAVGVVLVVQGVGFYVGTSSKSITALIPTFVCLPILCLGLLALKESARKHAMHAAAALAMLGLLAAVGRMASAGVAISPAGISVVMLALITGGFLILCVKSFVDARRRKDGPGQ
jgi:peptidoglycan/LPS O-acetylase OafA/YrhL